MEAGEFNEFLDRLVLLRGPVAEVEFGLGNAFATIGVVAELLLLAFREARQAVADSLFLNVQSPVDGVS